MRLYQLLFSTLFLIFTVSLANAHHQTERQEHPLNGGEIRLLLAGNTAYLDNGAVQSFAVDGTTLYQSTSQALERGFWRIEGDRYCSQWSGRWSCYDMTGDKAKRITWLKNSAHYGARLESGLLLAK